MNTVSEDKILETRGAEYQRSKPDYALEIIIVITDEAYFPVRFCAYWQHTQDMNMHML